MRNKTKPVVIYSSEGRLEFTDWNSYKEWLRTKLKPLSQESKDARKPLPPEVLVSTLPDIPYVNFGKSRVPRVHRVKSK